MIRKAFIAALAFALLSGSGLLTLPGIARAQDPAEQRQQHEQAMDKKLKELNRKMDELAAGTRKAGGQARDELNRLYDEFKKKEPGARKDLEEMRRATNETWDKAKVQMNKAVEELNGIYERAKTGSGEKKDPEPGK